MTATAADAAVVVEQVTVEYSRGNVRSRPLDHFDLRVAPGSLVLLLGPSGCGKTTLLSCLAGIRSPDAGRITVNGTVITDLTGRRLTEYRQRGVGVVHQAFNLIASMSALENVMMPMRAAGERRAAARRRAGALLDGVGLGERVRHRPSEMSGGQQQRVAIARALANDPPLVLADEPTASLDHLQVEIVLRTLRSIADGGRTVIVSTHDPRLMHLADRIVEMVPLEAHRPRGPARHQFDAGDVIFHEGSRGDLVYRVESGEVELVRSAADGSPDLLGVAGPGDDFGEMGALFDIQRSATARARTACTLVAYSAEEFKAHFGAQHIMRLIAGRATFSRPRPSAAGSSPSAPTGSAARAPAPSDDR